MDDAEIRKRDLTPEEHAVCDATAQLRRKMGLSQGQMARQVGTTTRSISRWERHLCVPQPRHLARLEQLQRMLDEPPEPGRSVPVRFDNRPHRKIHPGLTTAQLKVYARQLIGGLLAKLGGHTVVEKDELLVKNGRLQVRLNPDGSFVLEMDSKVAAKLRGETQDESL